VRTLLACIAGLLVAGTSLGASPPQPLDPIVIGGDKPESRGIASCERDFGQDATGAWLNQLVRSLCKQGDANSLFDVFLITAPSFGTSGSPDFATLDRAYALGQESPLVLWTVVMLSKCNAPFQVSECDRMLKAARMLSHADPDNAMAWLTLGYAADRSLGSPDEISSALDRATAARRFHDYGFDVMKRGVVVSGRSPVPDAVLGRQSAEHFRKQFISPFEIPTHLLVDWVNQGCNATNAVPPSSVTQCANAKALFRRGDSEETLSGDPDALAEINAMKVPTQAMDPAVYDKNLIAALTNATSGREFASLMARRQGDH